jgi:hypothetical protein
MPCYGIQRVATLVREFLGGKPVSTWMPPDYSHCWMWTLELAIAILAFTAIFLWERHEQIAKETSRGVMTHPACNAEGEIRWGFMAFLCTKLLSTVLVA